jgi:hypothetical protein
MKNLSLFSLLLTAATALAAQAPVSLEFARGAVHAHCQFTAGPQTPDESRMKITWMNATNSKPADPPGVFAVDLFMPGMGHGSSPTQIKKVADATYEISNMFFVMGGKWQVNVTLNSTDGTKETKTIDVDVPGSMAHHH